MDFIIPIDLYLIRRNFIYIYLYHFVQGYLHMGQNLQDGENLQYLSFLFWKAKPVRVVKWRYQTLVKCCLSQIYGGFKLLKKKIRKSIMMDFFDGFFERFFHYIEKHINLSIENILLYDRYEYFVVYSERENDLNFLKHPEFK